MSSSLPNLNNCNANALNTQITHFQYPNWVNGQIGSYQKFHMQQKAHQLTTKSMQIASHSHLRTDNSFNTFTYQYKSQIVQKCKSDNAKYKAHESKSLHLLNEKIENEQQQKQKQKQKRSNRQNMQAMQGKHSAQNQYNDYYNEQCNIAVLYSYFQEPLANSIHKNVDISFDKDHLIYQQLQTVVNDSCSSNNTKSEIAIVQQIQNDKQVPQNQPSEFNLMNCAFIQSELCLSSQNITDYADAKIENERYEEKQRSQEIIQMHCFGQNENNGQHICECDDEQCFINNYIRSSSISGSNQEQEEELRNQVSKMRIEDQGKQQRYKQILHYRQNLPSPQLIQQRTTNQCETTKQNEKNQQRSFSFNASYSVKQGLNIASQSSESAQDEQIIGILALINANDSKKATAKFNSKIY